MAKHPIQPLERDEHGVIRFKPNKIVQHLLDKGGLDLNQLARLDFEADEWNQFAQLIGYSHSGFGGLSYASNETYEASEKMFNTGLSEIEARSEHLREELEAIRAGLRDAVARLYGIHPDDLEATRS